MPYFFDKTPRRFLGDGIYFKNPFLKLLILKLDVESIICKYS